MHPTFFSALVSLDAGNYRSRLMEAERTYRSRRRRTKSFTAREERPHPLLAQFFSGELDEQALQARLTDRDVADFGARLGDASLTYMFVSRNLGICLVLLGGWCLVACDSEASQTAPNGPDQNGGGPTLERG